MPLLPFSNKPPAGGANTALSNLASVLINHSLLFDTDSAYDIGDSGNAVANLWVDVIAAINGVNLAIRTNTSDGFDNKEIRIYHGDRTSPSSTRGANIILQGNEAGYGDLLLKSGNNAGEISFYAGVLQRKLIYSQTALYSDSDSMVDLGTLTKYFDNCFFDKIFLNATATIDGAIAGQHTIVGNLVFSGNTGLGFGCMFVDGTQVIVVAMTQDNIAEVEDSVSSADHGWLAGAINNVTFPTGGTEHYLTVSKPGKYEVSWSMSFAAIAPGANIEIHGGVMIDGTAVRDKAEAHRTIANNSDTGNMSGTAIFNCPNGTEQISLWLLNTTNDANASVGHGNVRIMQIGGT